MRRECVGFGRGWRCHDQGMLEILDERGGAGIGGCAEDFEMPRDIT